MEGKGQSVIEVPPGTLAQAPGGNGATSPASVPDPTLPVREPRRQPRISETPPAPAPPPLLADYEPLIGKGELDEIRFLAADLKGKTIKMVNSTAVGGGVAEMLNRLVPLLSEVEVPTRWEVITGGNDFFEITKAFHNALHGGEYQLTPEVKEVFLRYSEQNQQRLQFDQDVVVIHDPQPAALIRARQGGHSKWVWRCHIDLSNPNRDVWDFLQPMIEQFDAAIFSQPSFCTAARHFAVFVLSLH
jgi:trehalose synthase